MNSFPKNSLLSLRGLPYLVFSPEFTSLKRCATWNLKVPARLPQKSERKFVTNETPFCNGSEKKSKMQMKKKTSPHFTVASHSFPFKVGQEWGKEYKKGKVNLT